MIDTLLSKTRTFIPRPVFRFFNPIYHMTLALCGALIYRFPSRHIKVIAVTGTKGKSSTVEILNAILEEAGYKTALTNTIRFKIGDSSEDNLYKMSMPGRFFMQSFLRRAIKADCDYAILEMTSQGAAASRHRWIDLNVFVLTNISPEHIEAHGSYEAYIDAKLSIVRDGIGHSHKKNRAVIVNGDDKESSRFVATVHGKGVREIHYSLSDAEPYQIQTTGIDFSWNGAKIHSPLSGLFNLSNILAAATVAQSQGVSDEVIIRTIKRFAGIPGRVEKIEVTTINGKKQDFTVIVDYAHTLDSLEKLYRVFRPDPAAPREHKIIAILGGTGGGRDTWKRTGMGKLADLYCDDVILTDEDPYDEDPRKIVDEVASGIVSKEPIIIMDRRGAISEALRRANRGDVVLITGKGTDPYIMGPRGTKTPWSDAQITREELEKIQNYKS